MGKGLREQLADNPFYVLGLPSQCSRAEAEREGQKLLGMLELGLSAALTYRTPVGTEQRTADKVRQALAELRDPERRLLHELWARLPVADPGSAGGPLPERGAPPEEAPRQPPWQEAMLALGYRAQRGGER